MNSEGFKETDIGMIPEDWVLKMVKDITNQVCVGFVGSCSKYYCNESEGFPMIRTTNLTDNGISYNNLKYVLPEFHEKNKKSQLKKGDLVIARHGENGQICSFDENFEANCLNIVVIKPDNDRLYNKYLLYSFKSPLIRHQIEASIVGSVQGVLNTKTIQKLEIPYPPLSEQHKIADFFEKIDDLIEINKQINHSLEEICQAIFRHWFVHFEFPDGEGRPYKSNDGEMVDSELGEIPKGWKFGEIGDIITEKKDKIKKDKKYEVLSAVKTGNLVRSDDYFDKRVYSKDISKYKEVLKYNFAYNPARINIGSIGMLDINILGAVSPVYTVFKPQDNCHIFINMLLKQKSIKKQIIQFCSGTVRQTLDYNGFSKIQTIIPDLNVILQYNKKYEKIINLINHNKKENETLSNIRDLILPKLITGKIRVKPNEEATVQ